ncbi:MAG: hypothetical protein H6837_13465 [Planctomycetes bacterium]|nr:hypothetical protein [Planctomycetota bacterium]
MGLRLAAHGASWCVFGLHATALLLAAVSSPAQGKPKPATPPTVDARLVELRKLCFDKAAKHDAAALEILTDLNKRFAKLSPAERSAVARTTGELLRSPRCRRPAKSDQLFRAIVRLLGCAGKQGGNELWGAFQLHRSTKKFHGKEWLPLRGQMLEQLGQTKDERHIKNLMAVARHDTEPVLMARAGAALRHFKDSSHAVRRDQIVKDLIKRFAEVNDTASDYTNTSPGHYEQVQTCQRILAEIADPWTAALQVLTRQRCRTTAEWTKFWNRHKSDATWDPPKAKGRDGKSKGKKDPAKSRP